MKNYFIGTLFVAILILSSLLYKSYKNNETPFNQGFPLVTDSRDNQPEIPLHLYVFFSKKNCHDCLEVIQELNKLPSQFIITGVVPTNELKNTDELRRITGASFPLKSAKEFKKFLPWYAPSIMAVSPAGEVIMVLPVIPGEKGYLEKYISALYLKALPVFIDDRIARDKNK